MGATFTSRTYRLVVLVQLVTDIGAAEVWKCYARARETLVSLLHRISAALRRTKISTGYYLAFFDQRCIYHKIISNRSPEYANNNRHRP